MADELERLQRWTAYGGSCLLIDLGPERAEIALCRCDGGEVVERFETSDPEIIDWVRANES